jgi:hypothetical protein
VSGDPAKQLEELLKEAGAVLLRAHKHRVYELPGGRRFITPKSPGDWRGAMNGLKVLRRLLNQQSDGRE